MTWRNHSIRRPGWLLLMMVLAMPCAATSAQETPTLQWKRLADLPQGVVDPAASISGQQLVVSGGINMGGAAVDLVQVMDLSTMRWTRILHLHKARYNHGQITLHDGRVLVVGGRTRQVEGSVPSLDSCELIDLATGTVRTTATLPTKITAPTLNMLDDGRVVAVGEHIASVYDPATQSWSEPIRMTRRRVSHRSVLIGRRRVLVIGGTGMQTLEVIDLEKMEATYYAGPRLPFPLDDMCCWRLDAGRVWVIGGQMLNGQTVDQTWLINLRNGEPVTVQNGPHVGLEVGISDQVMAMTRWGLVVAGGEAEDGRTHKDTELSAAFLLDTATLKAQRLPDLSVPHDDAAAVAWQGSIIVLGGEAPGSILGLALPTPVRAVEMLEEK